MTLTQTRESPFLQKMLSNNKQQLLQQLVAVPILASLLICQHTTYGFLVRPQHVVSTNHVGANTKTVDGNNDFPRGLIKMNNENGSNSNEKVCIIACCCSRRQHLKRFDSPLWLLLPTHSTCCTPSSSSFSSYAQ